MITETEPKLEPKEEVNYCLICQVIKEYKRRTSRDNTRRRGINI
jgi:hypothetical protein